MLHIPENFIPVYIFSNEWLNGPFSVPEDKGERIKLFHQLESYSHYCILWRSEYEHVRKILLKRLELLNPPPKQGVDIPVPPYLFNKEWRDGNFMINSDPDIRAKIREDLALYANASVLYEPRHRQVQTELRARLAAFKAYNSVKG